MKSLSNTIIFITGLTVLAGIALLLYVSSAYLIDQYERLDPQWAAGIFIVSVVVLICTLILGRAIHSISENKDKIIHPEKSVVYGNFIELLSQNSTLQAFEEIDATNLQNQRKQLTLWAADDVLKEYLILEKQASTDDNNIELQLQAEKVVLAMRKDLGNQNLGISRGDLSTLFNHSK